MADKEGGVAVNDRDKDEGKQLELETFIVGDKEGTIKPNPEPTDSIEIEIKDEEPAAEGDEPAADAGGEEPAADARPTKNDGNKRPNKVPTTRRIAQLTAEKYALAEEAARERAENARLKNELEQLNRANMANYEQTVESKIERAKQKLRDARNSGDVDAETDAQLELSQAAAEKNDIEAWKRRNPQPQPGQQKAQQQGQPQQQRLNADQQRAIQGWIQQNDWFDPNSPNYDADMQKDVGEFAKRVETWLVRQGRINEIATDAYFKVINDYINKNWSGEDGESPNMSAPEGGAAPVAKSGTTAKAAGGGVSGGMKVTLSAAERDMAHRLDLRHPNGKAYTPAEKEYAYAKNKIRANKK